MTIRYSPRSKRDLATIGDFVAVESGSRPLADSFLIRLLDSCDALSIFPERYPVYRYAKAWRMMPFENYLVFFKIHGNEVRVGHIRHAARKLFAG